MGDINQIIFGRKHLPHAGSVIEIGSKNYGNTSSFREYYKDSYTGVDIESGNGVDVVQDLTKGIGDLGQYDIGICCSVLEHTPKPWLMADNITRLIKPGGSLYVSVPWVQRYHAYPDDYFRFSPRGIEAIFPEFVWSLQCFSTSKEGEFIEFKKGSDNKMALMNDGRKYLPYFFTHMIGVKRCG